jgi:glycosyltransferase involved in cell wall biosynthesis
MEPIMTTEQNTRSLSIALVTETFPPEINGVAMTLGRLVDGLLERGHIVQLIRPRQSSDEGVAGRLSRHGLSERLMPGVPIPKYSGLRCGLPMGLHLMRLWQRNRPDIVHVATEGPLGWSALNAARRLGLPVSSGFHTNFHNYTRHYGLGWLQRPISGYLRAFHNRSDVTLVPTQKLAATLRLDDYQNVEVLARGVDTELFNPKRRSMALRAAWGLAEQQLLVIYVGRLAAEKNLSLVLSAYDAIRIRRKEARLLLVGDGPLRPHLAARCPEAIFAGMRSGQELAAHYASADLFLFPSMTETFGNVTTEALASGLGVVAYDDAAAGELIQNGHNGRKVMLGDAAGFVAAAVDLAINGNDLARIREQSAASVSHLDWEKIHDRFASILTNTRSARAAAA